MEQYPRASALSFDQLKARARVEAPTIAPVSRDRLAVIASERLSRPFVPIIHAPVMELSARQPYDPTNGHVDVYKPGRWDTSSGLIFMDFIVTGQNPGEWDGSVAYVEFKAHSSGDHLVAVRFTGFQTTMTLNGPWGSNTAFTAVTTDSGVVLASWNGNAGTSLFFTVHCAGPSNLAGVGYIKSVEVYG